MARKWIPSSRRASAVLLGAGLLAASTASAEPYTFINIVDNAGPYAGFNAPAINDTGTVVFHGFLDNTGATGIFTGPDPLAHAVATVDGPYSAFDESPAINNAGTVVFLADRDAGGSGIFTGPDPVADKVIARGDSLVSDL